MAEPKRDNRIKRQDDRLWKAVLEHVFRDFLLFFFPESRNLFDFKRGFVYLDKEMDELFPEHRRGGNKGVRYVDKLVKVFLKNGGERFILIHIEAQSQKRRGDLARKEYGSNGNNGIFIGQGRAERLRKGDRERQGVRRSQPFSSRQIHRFRDCQLCDGE